MPHQRSRQHSTEMLGRMADGVTDQRDASFDRPRHSGTAAPLLAPPKLFLTDDDGGVSGGSPALVGPVMMSPTSTLHQAAAAGSPTSPVVATAAPFSRHGARSSSSGGSDSHRRKSKMMAWEREATPAGIGLAGALNGDDAIPPAATVLRGHSFRCPALAADGLARSSSPRGQWRLMSPREMEESDDYTRVIDRGGPNPRTTHIFDGEHFSGGGFSEGTRSEFLRWCHGCSKDLGQGKDIFMYRGEMAFCSHECRYREMLLFGKE